MAQSMLPLLIKDGLLIPTIATTVLFTILSFSTLPVFNDQNKKYKGSQKLIWCQKFVFFLSIIGAVLLMVAMVTLKPPARLPDLYPVLISAYSCAHFLLFLVYFHIQQFQCNTTHITKEASVI
ncbi:hypothetical protein KUTeg_016672 [Tegillarca granosa]|uniref:Alpha-1,3-glucosyltransferase n=1 Tax=Tegillarca granosa TaxID=220873 RepID=A0ABQ9ELJ3_TEGGR|nr:hypothetical protein KUTeg_016672 [Tegillarca granosa]